MFPSMPTWHGWIKRFSCRSVMTKAQTIRFLNRAYTHVIANCWGWTDDLYKGWRDAQDVLLHAKREVVKP